MRHVKIKRRGDFSGMLNELTTQDESLERIIIERTKWFQNNPQDTRLENHPLRGDMTGQWAFSITDDIRIIYEWISKTTVRFLAIGGHQKVYKRKNSN